MKSGASYFREAAGVQKKYDLLVNKMTERKSQIDKRALRAREHVRLEKRIPFLVEFRTKYHNLFLHIFLGYFIAIKSHKQCTSSQHSALCVFRCRHPNYRPSKYQQNDELKMSTLSEPSRQPPAGARCHPQGLR
jgi:hypothetical protein